MFSYRHSFHAGNHADVLKHTCLVATLRHLLQKEAALTVLDTHAGAGLYRLDSEHAQTSGEAADGVQRLQALDANEPLAPALQDYLSLVDSFNPARHKAIYPGSPFLTQRLLRPQDRLKLFELHPTDTRALTANIEQLEAGKQVAVLCEDGFEGVRKFLPPPSRRGLVLCDPSYELKSDYARAATLITDALKRFATGVYAVWYPIIPRPEAHSLPRRLKTVAQQAGKPWLHATLTVKSSKITPGADGAGRHAGLPASGMFIVNPPHTLQPALQAALPQLARLLAQDRHAAWSLDAGH